MQQILFAQQWKNKQNETRKTEDDSDADEEKK